MRLLLLVLTLAAMGTFFSGCNESGLSDVLPVSDDSSGSSRPRIFRPEVPPEEPPPENVTPVRPTGQVFLDNDFCLCKANLPFQFASGSICDSRCASIGSENPVLVGNTTLGEQLTLDQDIFKGELVNWCKAPLSEEDQNADCVAVLREQFGNGSEFTVPITIGADNNYQIDFAAQLQEDKVYSMRIRASSSLTEAFSDFIQFRVQDNTTPQDFGGKLQIGTSKRYYCLIFTGATTSDRDNEFKIHFMFDAANDPPVIPDGVVQFLCHDESRGTPDSPLFPRLGEELAFKLWDKVDRRFFVNNPDDPDNSQGENDINLFVKKRLKEKFDQTLTSVGLFNALEARTFPGSSNDSPDQTIGFKLQSFTDPDDIDFPFCPTEVDLQRSQSDENFDPLFNVLGEFISETEALYMALRTPRQLDPISNNFVDDVMFINQTQLEKIWFYRNGSNQPTYLDPADTNFRNIIKSETMYYYWPPNEAAPTVKLAQQELYKVQTREEILAEINGTTISNGGAAPPADKRIGCIPKTD